MVTRQTPTDKQQPTAGEKSPAFLFGKEQKYLNIDITIFSVTLLFSVSYLGG